MDAAALAALQRDVSGLDRGWGAGRAAALADAEAEGVGGSEADVADSGVDAAVVLEGVGGVAGVPASSASLVEVPFGSRIKTGLSNSLT